ncbi:MAG: DUF4157 domain-containing protein [Dehalococcoidia bacterium]|nr:DUF4157 domain-containing protein [Dehalococcoidia bacterium]
MVESQYASESLRGAARRKANTTDAAAPANPLLRMQRQLGNQHVARMLAQRVGAEEDEMMQGKHDVALAQRVGAEEDEMMQGKHDAALAQRVGAEEDEMMQGKHDAALAQRVGAEEEEKQGKHDAALAQRVGAEEDEMMQGKHDAALAQRAPAAPTVGLEGGPVGEDLQSRIDSKRGGGSGLSDTVRATAEASLGTSFADVRVHRDAESDALNRAITAKAFTTGSDIFLREDQNPGDMNLMAHELTHVVQQRGGGGGVSRMLTVGAADDPFEREADSVADAVVSGQGQRALDEMKG